MGPTRKITEIKVKFSGISEIYPRLYVFQISWEHPDKRANSTKGESGWWLSLFSEKMGEGNLSSLIHFVQNGPLLCCVRKKGGKDGVK